MHPRSLRIVLVGGGHAHALALARGLPDPAAGIDVTLVARDVLTPYSGMVPGVIAGAYSAEQAHIDLLRLVRATGARIIAAEAEGLDSRRKLLFLKGRPALPYDIMSVNVGIVPDTSRIDGAHHATTVKPIGGLIAKVEAVASRAAAGNLKRLVVVGGGAAGFEVALAMHRRLAGSGVAVTLVTRDGLLATHHRRVQDIARTVLTGKGIDLVDGFDVRRIDERGLDAADGRRIEADEVLLNTAAAAPAWFASTGLSLDPAGFLAVSPTLQSLDDPDVFACGDCAAMVQSPRPKAGVFAVRQGPFIAFNVTELARARLAGRPPRLKVFRPQASALALLATADGRAIVSRGAITGIGPLAWWWKDRIDRAFMEAIAAAGPVQVEPRPIDADEGQGLAGPALVHRVLPRAGLAVEPDRLDSVTLSEVGGLVTVTAVTTLPDCLDDTFRFGELAAIHAFGPVVAAGAEPRSLSVAVRLPRAAAGVTEAALTDIVAGLARSCMRMGAAIGAIEAETASTTGLTLTATGMARAEALTGLSGARPGDVLVLVKPIGAGLILAADRQGLVKGADWLEAIDQAMRPPVEAARILRARGASSMAAIGRLGLAGTLIRIASASQVACAVSVAAVPLLVGVRAIAETGAATGHVSNLALASQIVGAGLEAADCAIWFAPEIGAPILASMPPDAVRSAVALLVEAGERPVIIGQVIDRMPGIDGALVIRPA